MSGPISRLGYQWANLRNRLLSDQINSPRLYSKTILRGITALLALVAFISFSIAIPMWNQNLVHTNGPDMGDWQDGIPIAPLVLAFIYNIFATIYAIKTSKAVRYVIEAVIDFLVWAILVPGLIFAIWGGVFNVWQIQLETNNTAMMMCGPASNAFSQACFPEIYVIGILELGGITFAFLVWGMHMFLSIHGIIERCTRSRRVKKQAAAEEMVKNLENNNWGDQGSQLRSYFYN